MNLLELVDAAMAELEPARVQPSRNDDPLDEIAAVFSEFDPAIILPKQSVNEARVVETTTDTPPGQDEVSGGVYVRTLNPDHGRPVSRWFTVKRLPAPMATRRASSCSAATTVNGYGRPKMRHRRLRDKDLAGQPRHMAAVRREHRRIDKEFDERLARGLTDEKLHRLGQKRHKRQKGEGDRFSVVSFTKDRLRRRKFSPKS